MNKNELINFLKLENKKRGIHYVDIQMPNEIFDDLGKQDFKNFNHKCFAYSYYYLINFMYRNAIYGEVYDSTYSLDSMSRVLVSKKQLFNYITIEGGILDAMGYTETTRDYPTSVNVNAEHLSFNTLSMSPDRPIEHNCNLKIKYPIKSFNRFTFEEIDGTYYFFDNTHPITIKNFIDMVTNKDIGYIGFFIYGYLRMMCKKHEDGYMILNKELADIVGCSDRTLSKYTIALEENGFIKSRRNVIQGKKLMEKIYTMY